MEPRFTSRRNTRQAAALQANQSYYGHSFSNTDGFDNRYLSDDFGRGNDQHGRHIPFYPSPNNDDSSPFMSGGVNTQRHTYDSRREPTNDLAHASADPSSFPPVINSLQSDSYPSHLSSPNFTHSSPEQIFNHSSLTSIPTAGARSQYPDPTSDPYFNEYFTQGTIPYDHFPAFSMSSGHGTPTPSGQHSSPESQNQATSAYRLTQEAIHGSTYTTPAPQASTSAANDTGLAFDYNDFDFDNAFSGIDAVDDHFDKGRDDFKLGNRAKNAPWPQTFAEQRPYATRFYQAMTDISQLPPVNTPANATEEVKAIGSKQKADQRPWREAVNPPKDVYGRSCKVVHRMALIYKEGASPMFCAPGGKSRKGMWEKDLTFDERFDFAMALVRVNKGVANNIMDNDKFDLLCAGPVKMAKRNASNKKGNEVKAKQIKVGKRKMSDEDEETDGSDKRRKTTKGGKASKNGKGKTAQAQEEADDAKAQTEDESTLLEQSTTTAAATPTVIQQPIPSAYTTPTFTGHANAAHHTLPTHSRPALGDTTLQRGNMQLGQNRANANVNNQDVPKPQSQPTGPVYIGENRTHNPRGGRGGGQ